jgi:prevent-host-death family protein
MAQVSKSAFKPKALEYFRTVQRTGEALIITDHGKPVLKIVPYEEDIEGALASLRGTVLAYDDPEAPVAQDDWEVLR